MKRTTTSAVAVVLVLVLVVVVVAAVVGFGTDGASAVEVGDQKVSREDINDELRAVADNQQLIRSVGADRVSISPGTVTADASVALVMHGVVQEALMKEYLDRNDERVTADDRANGKSLYESGFGSIANGFPDWYEARVTERLAVYSAFARVTGIDLQSEDAVTDTANELRPIARKAGVTVDPRYGRYDAQNVTVVPFKLPAGLVDSTSSASSN
jgi:hypothetical protein